MLLKDKVAVITGGAGMNGLGFASAKMMAAQGATVVILDLESTNPQAAASALGSQHLGLVANVTDKASCAAAAAAIKVKFGRIDILLNNAGITQPSKFLDGILGGPHYSAAKAGVLGLARAMAREFGGNNIRVNCITPGLIATDINKGKIPVDKHQAILDGIPLARIGEPNDVAGAVVFLASDLSKYCTGITLDVNGGMLIH